jgi:hypothetical protein
MEHIHEQQPPFFFSFLASFATTSAVLVSLRFAYGSNSCTPSVFSPSLPGRFFPLPAGPAVLSLATIPK